MTYRCELCPQNCRLMDFNYSSEKIKLIVKRCEPNNAFISFKIKGCKMIHHLGVLDIEKMFTSIRLRLTTYYKMILSKSEFNSN